MSTTTRQSARHAAFWATTALALLLVLGIADDVRADAKKGKMTYSMLCASCHGPKGEGMRSVNSPALTGLSDWYMVSQLKKFKSGERGSHPDDVTGSQMAAIALTLANEAAMQDVTDYIKTLGAFTPTQFEVEGDVANGKAIYAKVCQECHGESGQGLEERLSSTLVGQNDWYLLAQLEKFRAGHRGTAETDSTGAEMAKIAQELESEEAMRDVIAYISSLESK